MSYSQRRTRAWKPTALCIEVVPGGPLSSTSSLDVRIDGLQEYTEISDDMTPPSLDDQEKVESRAGHDEEQEWEGPDYDRGSHNKLCKHHPGSSRHILSLPT